MKKSSLVLFQGNGFAIQGPKRFEKDVLRVGYWRHPVTGQSVQITQERINRLAANTTKLLDSMDRKAIPFQDGHTWDAKKTLGWWTGFRAEGDRLIGTVEVTDLEAARKITEGSIRSVSARIDVDVKDTRGEVYDEAMTHVCATPIPVLDGQQDFVKLSREADPVDLVIPQHLTGMSPEDDTKEIRMLKKIALALGLPEDATEETVLAAMAKQGSDLKGLLAGRTALAAVLEKDYGLKLDGEKVVKLSATPPADEPAYVKELRARLDKSERAQHLARQEDLQKAIDGFVQGGQLPPSGKAIADRMLSRVKEGQTLMLSGTSAEAVGRFGQIMEENSKDLVELMRILPKLTGHQLSAAQQDEAKKSEEASEARAKEIAERTQPELAKK